jgi:hypothetical protein
VGNLKLLVGTPAILDSGLSEIGMRSERRGIGDVGLRRGPSISDAIRSWSIVLSQYLIDFVAQYLCKRAENAHAISASKAPVRSILSC